MVIFESARHDFAICRLLEQLRVDLVELQQVQRRDHAAVFESKVTHEVMASQLLALGVSVQRLLSVHRRIFALSSQLADWAFALRMLFRRVVAVYLVDPVEDFVEVQAVLLLRFFTW